MGKGDCGAQAEQCFKNLETVLRTAGATLDDVTKITAFLVDVNDYADYASVRLRYFPADGPASSSVIVKELVMPEFLLEVEAIASVS